MLQVELLKIALKIAEMEESGVEATPEAIMELAARLEIWVKDEPIRFKAHMDKK